MESQTKLSKESEFAPNITDIDMNELMARVRNHVLSKRIRVKEFFQDMDPLNSGLITKSQFIRCIASFGLSNLGQFPISKAQTEALCLQYKCASDPIKINWKNFETDLESGVLKYTLKNSYDRLNFLFNFRFSVYATGA